MNGLILRASLFLFILICVSSCHNNSFNSRNWKAANVDEADNTRKHMVDDLIESKVLIGKDFTEVRELIGYDREGKIDSLEDKYRYLYIHEVWISYGMDIDPVRGGRITVTYDSITRRVNDVKYTEWDNND